jgi:hypothetical protein
MNEDYNKLYLGSLNITIILLHSLVPSRLMPIKKLRMPGHYE